MALLNRPGVSLLSMLTVAISLGGPAKAETTLYDQLGGQAAITEVVNRFLAIVTVDDRTKADFDNINLEWLKPRLRDYFCQLTGGPCQYKGRALGPAHEGLDVNQAKFNAVAEDLQTAMEQAGVSYRTQNRLLARLAPMQRDIVRR